MPERVWEVALPGEQKRRVLEDVRENGDDARDSSGSSAFSYEVMSRNAQTRGNKGGLTCAMHCAEDVIWECFEMFM